MRFLPFLMLVGCGLIWDPDGYRDDDPSDAAIDAGIDTGVDAAVDAGTDAETDVGIDAGACVRGVAPSGEIFEDLTDVVITHSGPGPALTVNTEGIEIRNVKIVITGDGRGIDVLEGADNLQITNVRVAREEAPVTFQIRPALRVTGVLGDVVTNLHVDGFEVIGMEGVQLQRVDRAMLRRIRIADIAPGDCLEAGCSTATPTLRLSAFRTEDTSLRPDIDLGICP